MQLLYRLARIVDFLALTLAIIVAAGGDVPRLTGESDRVRFFTRDIEFDYPNWVWGATWLKLEQSALNTPYLFERGKNKQLVFEYLRVTQQLIQTEGSIEQIFADPAVTDKESASAFLRTQRDELIAQQPLQRRDASRMLIVNRDKQSLDDSRFETFAEYIRPGDVIVVNNTRVFPARLIGQRDPSGGRVEVLG